MKKLLSALPLLFLSLSIMAQEPYAVAPEHYGLVSTVDYDGKKLTGLCELKLTNTGRQPVDSISFLLYRLMKVTAVTDAGDQPLFHTQ